jgi:signal transduction histidine kinase
MMVSLTFSVVIFGLVSREVDRFEEMQRIRVERRLRDDILLPPGSLPFRRYIEEHGMANPELVQETKERILSLLILANGTILILAGWLGYLLAGHTLRPIKKMVDDQHRFISDASHELKTPLASLKIAFEVYLRDHNRTVKEADVVMRESVEEVDKLQALSESLLEISEYEDENHTIVMEKVDIESVIVEAIKKTKNLARKKSIEFETHIKQIHLQGNKKGLVTVFTILIDNAIKYSNEKGRIEISTKTQDHTLIASIQDHGIGIGTEDLPRIFDRFYRADTARSRSGVGGNGLGLSIARQIAIKHGGTLYAKSTLGQGSIFTIELPISVRVQV